MYTHLKEIVSRTDISYLGKVFRLIDLHIEKLIKNRNFHKLIHHEIMLNQRNEVSESIQKIIVKSSSLTRSIIEDGIKSGEFRNVDVELTLSCLFGTINQLFLSKTICKIILKIEEPETDPFRGELKDRLVSFLRDLMKRYLVK